MEQSQQRLQAVQGRAAELQTLEKQREKIEQERLRLENRLAKNTLRAPAAGTVLTGQLEQRVGDRLQAGETVLEVAQTEGWQARIMVKETDLPKIEIGQPARLYVNAFPSMEYKVFEGTVEEIVAAPEPLVAVVTRVAQAALRVSGLWFTLRTRAVESIADEVADYLTERELPFVRSEKLAGRSGRGWTVDFHVRTHERSSLVYVLSSANRSAANRMTEHVLAAWHDLYHFAAGPEALNFVSLFDDATDVWTRENFLLMEPLSTVSHWSRPDEFERILLQTA